MLTRREWMRLASTSLVLGGVASGNVGENLGEVDDSVYFGNRIFSEPYGGPLCAKIICTKDYVPGCGLNKLVDPVRIAEPTAARNWAASFVYASGCIWELNGCKNIGECFDSALQRSRELTVIGPADKIILMTIYKDILWNLSGSYRCAKYENENTFFGWSRTNEIWSEMSQNEINTIRNSPYRADSEYLYNS